MKTLQVTLKKKWFDMESNLNELERKNEEYREIKPYWIKRLLNEPFATMCKDVADIQHAIDCGANVFKGFDSYKAKNGYAADAPTFERDLISIGIGKAKPEWSDNWRGDVFVITLGEILETYNMPEHRESWV